MILNICIYGATILLTLSGCGIFGGSETDEETAAEDTSVSASQSQSAGIAAKGKLAIAFPNQLNMNSAFVVDDDGSSLTSALNLAGDVKDFQSGREKKKALQAIFDADDINGCFQLRQRNFGQPDCFAPNLKRDAWVGNEDDFVISLGDDVTQLLYGDGGIVTETADGTDEACTAATINYFLESAIAAIDTGREIFASLVCASKFLEASLPAAGESQDYLNLLEDLDIDDYEFFEAEIALDNIAGVDTYTTKLGVSIDEEKIWAYFKHQPAESNAKGHALVFHSGLQDALASANLTLLGDPTPGDPPPGDANMPPPGGEPNSSPAGDGGATTEAVAVQYEYTEDGDLRATLDKVTFKNDTHPADYLRSEGDGKFDLAEIGKTDSSNGTGDNIVRAVFNQLAAGGGSGIVGWTASLSDSFWRSFAYEVTVDGDRETAKSTFGFSPSWDEQDETLTDPAAALGMFCSWAQMFGDPGAGGNQGDAEDNLEPAGPSGNGYNGVQYQVSTRADSSEVFAPDSDASLLGYTVGDDECGAGNSLAAVDSDGKTDDFTPPTVAKPSVIGDVDLDSGDINLD